MLALIVAVTALADVPSPGAAVLSNSFSIVEPVRTQTREEQEADLEEDMRDARRKLGHKDADKAGNKKSDDQEDSEADEQAEEESSEEDPGVAEGERDFDAEADLDEDMQELRERVDEEDADAEPSEVSPDDRRRRRPRRARENRQEVLYEGHGKGHYLGWGIADWVIAGGLFAGTLGSGIVTITSLVALSAGNSGIWGSAWIPAVVFGVATAVMGGLGGMLAYKATKNLKIYRQLKREEQELRYGMMPTPADRLAWLNPDPHRYR